jgi:hypothetical protein
MMATGLLSGILSLSFPGRLFVSKNWQENLTNKYSINERYLQEVAKKIISWYIDITT